MPTQGNGQTLKSGKALPGMPLEQHFLCAIAQLELFNDILHVL